MKNKISLISVLVIAFLVIFVSVKASANESEGGDKAEIKVTSQTGAGMMGDNGDGEGEDGAQMMNQNQVNLQDQNSVTGTTSVKVEDQNKVKESEKEMNNDNENNNEDSMSGDNNGDSVNSDNNSNDNNGEDNSKSNDNEEAKKAQERRSEVANAIQEMLKLSDSAKGGIGDQVKVIAQNQAQNHDDAEKSLEDANSRSGFVKFIIGPKYSEIKNAENIIAKNQEQIQQLNNIKAQLSNKGDQQTLDNQISILEKANLDLSNSLTDAQKGFSLFGWLSKIFVQ